MSVLRFWQLAALVAAVALAVVYVGCAWLPGAKWRVSWSEVERQERLAADHEHLHRQHEGIAALVDELAEGRLTLREAAAQLRAENERGPRHLDLHIEYLPGQTEEERYCRSVLAHARNYLRQDRRGPAVVARLEGELRALLRGRPSSEPSNGEEAPAGP